VSKRCFDLARTAGVSVGGAFGAGFKIIDRIDRIDRMLASRKVAETQRTARTAGSGNSSVKSDEDIRPEE
jgi:hypothetical protein